MRFNEHRFQEFLDRYVDGCEELSEELIRCGFVFATRAEFIELESLNDLNSLYGEDDEQLNDAIRDGFDFLSIEVTQEISNQGVTCKNLYEIPSSNFDEELTIKFCHIDTGRGRSSLLNVVAVCGDDWVDEVMNISERGVNCNQLDFYQLILKFDPNRQ